MGSIITCIRTKSAADLMLPKECFLSLKQSLSLSLAFSVIEIHILWPLVFSPALNISVRFLHLPYLYDESKVQMLGQIQKGPLCLTVEIQLCAKTVPKISAPCCSALTLASNSQWPILPPRVSWLFRKVKIHQVKSLSQMYAFTP